MKRRLLVGCLAAALILGGAYTVYWHHVAGRLAAGIADWAAQQPALGSAIEFQPGDITGFPFAFRRDFAAVTFVQPAADGLLTLRADAVTLSLRPWNLRAIDLAVAAPAGTFASPGHAAATLSASRVAGGIHLMADGRLEQMALRMRDLTVSDGRESYAAATADVTLNLPPLVPRDHRSPLLGFDLAIDNLALPPGRRVLTAGPVGQASLAGTIMGPVPAGVAPRAALAQWARGGGTVELSRFAFAQAPLSIDGEGTLALDHNLQALGALTIRAQGLPETIDLLAADGLIEPGAARTGRLMAKGLAKPDETGHEVVSVSLSLQEGYLWLGPVKLATLPTLGW